ncbi:hypothetical protein L1987_75889 [Smallanthus sonchifolius]|uniref:Uncharacterized protein n=1 Tax=Smallanthus sonchifolius TaxID=185202 RepID=A0ACB9A6T3_9ASTR|nr:hypothetical protein L1987_75889 [Smallanthus sonchifolius]
MELEGCNCRLPKYKGGCKVNFTWAENVGLQVNLIGLDHIDCNYTNNWAANSSCCTLLRWASISKRQCQIN